MNYQIRMEQDGKTVMTLKYILPDGEQLRMLIVGKTPVPESVAVGHYFQGRQGRMFWNRLKHYRILETPEGEFEDDYLLEHGFGITDVVKAPRKYGKEPSTAEYRAGVPRVMELISRHQPLITMFVYKRGLVKLVKYGFDENSRAGYGFNSQYEQLMGTKPSVFPMPGTPCKRELAQAVMTALHQEIGVLS